MRAATKAWKRASATSWLLQPTTVSRASRAPKRTSSATAGGAHHQVLAESGDEVPGAEAEAREEGEHGGEPLLADHQDLRVGRHHVHEDEGQEEQGVPAEDEGERRPPRDRLAGEVVHPAREGRVQGEDETGRGEGEEAHPQDPPEVEARAVDEAARPSSRPGASGRRRGGRRSGRPGAAGRRHPPRGSAGRRGPAPPRAKRPPGRAPWRSSSRFRKAKPVPRMSGERAEDGPSCRSDHSVHQS